MGCPENCQSRWCKAEFPNEKLLCRRQTVAAPTDLVKPTGLDYSSVMVAAGEKFSCALRKAFLPSLTCWGNNYYNKVGAVKEFANVYFTHVSLGGSHGCAIPKEQKGVKCWGRK